MLDAFYLGVARSEDGGLLPSAGAVPALDLAVNSSALFFLLADLTAASALLPPHDPTSRYPDMTAAYLRTAKRIHALIEAGGADVSGGVEAALEWARSEVSRMQEGDAELEPEERDDLFLACNVSKKLVVSCGAL